MHSKWILIAAMAAAAAAQPVVAQDKPAASKAAQSAAPEVAALSALVAPRRADLADAGIRKIVARAGKKNVEVITSRGVSFFRWPKNITPVPFELVVTDSAVTVGASDYADSKQDQYKAALDAVLAKALSIARDEKSKAAKPVSG